LHAAQSSRLVEIFPLLDLRTFSFPQRLKLFFFSPPSSWRPLFTLQRYPTCAILLLSKPLSTPWNFTCQLLFVVAKVIYSASVFLLWRTCRFRHLSFHFTFISVIRLSVSVVSPSFYAFFVQRSAFISFQSSYKPCCSETRCPSANTEFSPSTIHKSLFRPLFLSPHSPPSRRWVYINPPISTFIGAPGISLAPFPLSRSMVWRYKAMFSVLRFLLILVCAWSVVAFSIIISLSPVSPADICSHILSLLGRMNSWLRVS
jgi:hypothetical protein